jgi:hypothetical protein
VGLDKVAPYQVCNDARSGSDRQTLYRLAHDLRQRMYDLEILAG